MILATLDAWWLFAQRLESPADVLRLSALGLAACLTALGVRTVFHYHDYHRLLGLAGAGPYRLSVPLPLLLAGLLVWAGLMLYVILDISSWLGAGELTWRSPLANVTLAAGNVTAWLVLGRLRTMRHALKTVLTANEALNTHVT